MQERKMHLMRVKQQKEKEKHDTMKLVQEGESRFKEERDKLKQKRFSYKETLDQQIQKQSEMKNMHLMSKEEMNINRADLQAYANGDYMLSAKIPGITSTQKPQKDSKLSNYDNR
jgi:hypothetical protein